jgi:hypothetical protein
MRSGLLAAALQGEARLLFWALRHRADTEQNTETGRNPILPVSPLTLYGRVCGATLARQETPCAWRAGLRVAVKKLSSR